ncbi:hypothetical protein ACFQY0_01020 [Haloferula chungangensis]|uniref:Lipoprotein n=1 Tax=Haloferula chungangensis TaxID=1048331 RepID=A0ABW2L2G4_9BACT
MQRFKRRVLDPPLILQSMQTVKGLGILIASTLLFVACKEEGRDANTPERKSESPLKKVDEIISTVEGVKPPDKTKTVKPPPATGEEEVEAPKIPVAEPVPDKPGFVISPYNGKWIDVTGVKPGTLMADPHFTEEKKFFRVPQIPEAEQPETAPEEEGSEVAEEIL